MGKLASHRALQAKGVRKKTSARGQSFGSKRDTPAKSAKQVTRRETRLANGRVRDALAEARAAEEALDQMAPVVDEVLAPADGAALGAQFGALTKQVLGQIEVKHCATSAWRPTGLMAGLSCPACGMGFGDCDRKQRESKRSCCRHCSDVSDDVAHQVHPEEQRHPYEPWEGDPNPGWTIGAARRQLADGYHILAIVNRTGVGAKWLVDLVGKDGYSKEASS